MININLFFIFFKIGLFTFGGGYAMIPMIQDEVIGQGWLNLSALIDFIAISESTPGPFAINIATFIGNKTAGFLGAFSATAGVILPSFIVILIIAKYFHHFKDNFYVRSVLCGLRPIVIELIAAATVSVISLALLSVSAEGINSIDVKALIIFAVIFLISKFMKKIHPVFLILLGALFGVIAYGFI